MTPHPAGDDLVCARCGRTGDPGQLGAGWTVSRPPRPVGAVRPRTPEEQVATALCPDCSRRSLRDLEARLDA